MADTVCDRPSGGHALSPGGHGTVGPAPALSGQSDFARGAAWASCRPFWELSRPRRIDHGVLFALVAERMTSALPQGDRNREAVLNSVLAGSLGLGVLLIPLLGIRVDLEAVLFGDLLAAGPRELIQSLVAFAGIVALLVLRYRQYVYLGVDPVGARPLVCGSTPYVSC